MSGSIFLAENDNSSSTSNDSRTGHAEAVLQQEVARDTSSEGAGETDSSVSSSESSDDSNFAPPSVPALVSLESPLLAPIITALNATDRCTAVFANHGQNVLDNIPYDPEWWRRPSPPVLPPGDPEEAWKNLMAVELQRLNAFLRGKMERKLAAVAALEELIRMKVPRLRERYLRINDILACLGLLPEVQETLLNSAIVDGDCIQLLPVGVNPELDGSTLQQALDDMFWSQILDDSDSENPEDVPVLDKLSDVVVVSCQSWNTQLDAELWPERYTRGFLPEIQAKRKCRQSLKHQLRELQSQMSKMATINGANVPTSLEISTRAMKSTGQADAATELETALKTLKSEISEKSSRMQDLDKELIEESRATIELDKSKMAPYILKAVILFENEEETATTLSRSRSTPGMWVWQSQSRCYSVNLEQVLSATREAENFVAVYEKSTSESEVGDSDDATPVAPAIQQFCKEDNATMASVPLQAEEDASEHPSESISRESSAGPSSGNPWL